MAQIEELLKSVASGLPPSGPASVQSLISDLRQQYAASASVAVSQAMLLQALDQSRQVVAAAGRLMPQTIQSEPSGHLLNHQTREVQRASENSSSSTTTTTTATRLAESAPLDLSVKQDHDEQARQASRPRAPRGPRQSDQLPTSKLITSSTSPRNESPSSLSSHAPSFTRDHNNNQVSQVCHPLNGSSPPPPLSAPANHEIISSTNGKRQRRRRRQSSSSNSSGKKQKGASKSHLCNFCGRSFSRSDMLTRHSRLHSGLKPYQCGKCYQVFSRSDHLSTHERTHTGEKPYQCEFCDYSACRRDMITRHMRTHSAAGGPDNGGELARARLAKARRRRRRRAAADAEPSRPDKIACGEDDVSTSLEIS